MFEFVEHDIVRDDVIPISEMKPLDVGRVRNGLWEGEIVMRTASEHKFEVMVLSNPHEDRCWTSENCQEHILVHLFGRGTRLTFTIKVV